MIRPLVAWSGLAWFAGQAALMLALGMWPADPRMTGVAVFDLALAVCCAWYLRYPIGLYEAASNTYVEVWPFGLSWKRIPGRTGQALAVQGRRIVLTGDRTRTVLSQSLTHRVHYASVARLVHKTRYRAALAPDHPPRPGFLSRRHRIAGWAVVGLAVAGVLYQVVPASVLAEIADALAAPVADDAWSALTPWW